MRLAKIPLADTKAFSDFFLDYLQQRDSLKPFYDQFPSLENFNISLTKKSKSFPSQNRKVLVSVLTEQYKDLKLPEPVKRNIESLASENTFTVTTGHQLNIFTGPLYFIYKIVTVINTCRLLKKKYPQHNFVPVYWMASEDHDYDEIKYFRLDGKKYVWETKQTGAVGRFSTKEIVKLLDQIPGDLTPFAEAYKKFNKLSDSVRFYVNHLFGDEGVVVVDADNREQKSLFQDVMYRDIISHETLESVNHTNQQLEALGYKTQIHCREINFFYLDDNIRSRIEKQDGRFKVMDSNLNFSEEEMKKLILEHPEKLSPNVILRPLYQEMILPNLAYVGGPAEVIYWLQLKQVFDKTSTPFPVLMPRNFALVVEHTTQRKLAKTGLDIAELFEDKNYLFNHWVLKNTKHDLTVGKERDHLISLFGALRNKAASVDTTLEQHINAQGTRALKAVDNIEKKLLRAEKRLHADRLRQIEEVKDRLFPNGSLQERTDNFLNFYQEDRNFIKELINHFDPFDFRFHILTYGEQ